MPQTLNNYLLHLLIFSVKMGQHYSQPAGHDLVFPDVLKSLTKACHGWVKELANMQGENVNPELLEYFVQRCSEVETTLKDIRTRINIRTTAIVSGR